MLRRAKLFILFTLFVLVSSVMSEFVNKQMDKIKSRMNDETPEKIIIDTDAGVDDAIALLVALRKVRLEKNPEILAITTVSGNTHVKQVTINVLKTLREANCKVPVYIGTNDSILITPPNDNFYGQDGFGDVPYPNPPTLDEAEKEHAVQAMIRLVKQNPGQITFIALGPLTNVALATRLDPSFRKNLKSLYWLGSSTDGVGNIAPGIEFNAYIDPEANYIVFNSEGPPVIVLSWEAATIKGRVDISWRTDVLGKVNSSIVKFLNDIEKKALEFGSWGGCDSKMMSIVLWPEIVTKAEPHYMQAVTTGSESRGSFVVDHSDISGKPKNAVLIREFNVEMYKGILLKYLS